MNGARMHEILKKSYIFENLSEKALLDISSFSQEVKYAPGELIINEDQTASYDLYILLEGRVDVLISVMDHVSRDKEQKLIETIYPSDVFGEMSCILKKRRSASVKSIDQSELIKVDGLKLLNYMEAHKDSGYEILKKIVNVLSGRLLNTNYLLRNNFL